MAFRLARASVMSSSSVNARFCIARWRQNLALTELELITLALASLNAITYAFWWAKPYDVKEPVKVYVKTDRRSQDEPVPQLPVGPPSLPIIHSHE